MGIQDIWSGYLLTPAAASPFNVNLAWISGTWNIPNIRTPLWMNNPGPLWSSGAAETIIQYGFACSTWIGLQDSGAGGLIQVGFDSFVPKDTIPFRHLGFDFVPTSSEVVESDGFSAIFFAFFQWTSGGNTIPLPFYASPGDTVYALIQLLEPTSAGAVALRSEIKYGNDNRSMVAVIYLGNLTQGQFTAFAVSAASVGAKPLNAQRTACWVVEQSQNYGPTSATGTPSQPPVTETPRPGGGNPTNAFVVPMARYGSVFFTEAVCGEWTSASVASQVPVGWNAVAQPPSGYKLHFPSEAPEAALARGTNGPQFVTDLPWNYITVPTLPPPPKPKVKGTALPYPIPQPPLGDPRQTGLPFGGTAISAGQLVAQNVVLCKYVYPIG